jgi:hypothetical protein
MNLNVNGFLLEGIRTATSNNPFTYPPRTLITNQIALNASPGRAEYVIWVGGQSTISGIEIGDSNLVFYWSKNDGNIVRFDWDGFNRRWMTSPGAGQIQIGIFGNLPRVIAIPPDPIVPFSESPYAIYIGSPTRIMTFTVIPVATSAGFGNPSAGTVEISRDKGELNWGASDLANSSYTNQPVYFARQSFFDRQQNKGRVGTLPISISVDYSLFLNPIPAFGQTPRVRIGYRPYLRAIAVPDEASLGTPASGSFSFALDTGKLRFSTQDVTNYPSEVIYYDGVIMGSFSLSRETVGSVFNIWPNEVGTVSACIGLSDVTRFIWFIEPIGQPRFYYNIILGKGNSLNVPPDGSLYIDTLSGKVYVAPSDFSSTGAILTYVDTIHEIEYGVSIQFFRSAVNGFGPASVSDFKEIWPVSEQTIVDSLISSPMVMLPTVPLVDSILSYKIDAGTGGGSFVGDLVSSIDPSKLGIGFLLDLDTRQFKFFNRKTSQKILPKPSSTLKLDDAAISPFGFVAMRNGSYIVPGTDFNFDSTTGVVEFTEPIGENDPSNILGLNGTIALPNQLILQSSTLTLLQNGKYLVISSGLNTGIYLILSNTSNIITISGTFKQIERVTADIRTTVDVVVDRIWKSFSPPIKKLQILKGTNINGPFNSFSQENFTIIASKGQINLASPAKPGDIFKINYTSLDSTDNGVTVTPTSRTEFAGFKIRQELATFTPGTSIIHFNSDGKTVIPEFPITLYIDGVTQASETFTFVAPNMISVSFKLTSQQVIIDYYVAESPGGNTTFNLRYTPIDIDFPVITAGSNTSEFNGDQTFIKSGCPILIDDKDIVFVESAIYNAGTDVTTVTFNPIPSVGTSVNSKLKVTDSVNGSYLIPETLNVDTLPKGSNTLIILGNAFYPSGTIVVMDNDPYLVVSSTFDTKSGTTKIALATGAYRNYILPVVRKTIRPVYDPTLEVKTTKPVHLSFDTILFKNSTFLTRGVDYNISDGGVVHLDSTLEYGDVLYAFYVARVDQPAGTIFLFNYAMQIAPNQTNGLKGQKLISSYNLYNPDTFFFRIESITTFIPEVVDEVKKGSSGSVGPNVGSASSLKTKDYGNASLYFDEQHYYNVDTVVVRLLQYYNDQTNSYEDILANFDGRVVGGTSSRFRFNGDTSGTIRDSYAAVQNDIDDQVKLYDAIVMTGFFTFSSEPVYAPIWDYNQLSRFYGTFRQVTVAFNDKVQVSDFGSVIGSIGISNITSAGTFFTTPSRAKFIDIDITGTILTMMGTNGDVKNMIPPFVPTQKVNIFYPNGLLAINTIINSVSTTDPYQIVINDAINFQYGSVVADVSDPTNPALHFYQPGRQVSINQDNGQVINSRTSPLDPLAGQELVDINIGFVNKDTTPKRIPALDGLELMDSGSVSNPLLTYSNELKLCGIENRVLSGVGKGILIPDPIPDPFVTGTMAGLTMIVNTGDYIEFLDGPHKGVVVQVLSVAGNVTFTPKLSYTLSEVYHNLTIKNNPIGNIHDILNQEIGILFTNVAATPDPGAYIGYLNSEIISAINASISLGTSILDSNGIANGDTLTNSVNFELVTSPITSSCYVLVQNGDNTGLYKVKTVTSSTITLDTTSPFSAFPFNQNILYSIINPWSFVTPKQAVFLSPFIRKTLAFISATYAWANLITADGIPNRRVALASRKSDVTSFTSQIQSILTKEKIYDTRYLWIQQRIDRENGLLVKISQAAQKRIKAEEKLISDQKKILVVNQLV